MSKYPHTWGGKGLRLIDLLNQTERKQILNFVGNEQRFAALHVKGDASEFLKNADRANLISDYEDLVRPHAPVQTLEAMGYSVAMAMDGRRVVVRKGDPTPLRGSIPPGAKGPDEIAKEYLTGLQADGQMPPAYMTQVARKIVFVSPEFAEYLRANDENVKAFTKNNEDRPAFIWPAKHDRDVQRMLQNFQLASLGANAPDSGELAGIISIKTPKQYAAWEAGLGDHWRLMESLREMVLTGATRMTSGAFVDARAGGEMQQGLTAFQKAFQHMAEDAQTRNPRQVTADQIVEVGSHLRAVGLYLEDAPIKEAEVEALFKSVVELSACVADELYALCAQNEKDRTRTMDHSIEPAAGLS